MESGNEEKEIGKVGRPVLIFMKASPVDDSCYPLAIDKLFNGSASIRSDNEVSPFPGLTGKEADSTENGPKHPFLNGSPVHPVTCLNSQYHGDAAHDQDEGHDPYKHQGQCYAVEERD